MFLLVVALRTLKLSDKALAFQTISILNRRNPAIGSTDKFANPASDRRDLRLVAQKTQDGLRARLPQSESRLTSDGQHTYQKAQLDHPLPSPTELEYGHPLN